MMDCSSINVYLCDRAYPVYCLQGVEALSEPYQFQIVIHDDLLKLTCLQPAKLVFYHQQQAVRTLHTIITQLEESYHTLGRKINITLKPRLSLLANSVAPSVTVATSLKSMVRKLLVGVGYLPQQIKFHCQDKPIDYSLQLGSTFDLLQQLLAKMKLVFWMDSDEQGELIHFADSSRYCAYIELDFLDLTVLFSTLQTSHNISPDNSHQVNLHSRLAIWQPGYSVVLDNLGIFSQYQGDYVILAVTHTQGQKEGYQSQLQLCRREQPFAVPNRQVASQPSIFTGKIMALDNYPTLSEAGEYYYCYHFDDAPTTKSPVINKVSCYGGMHFPLHDGCEVLLGHFTQDGDKPIIIGALFNQEASSPVKAANGDDFICRSPQGNQILIHDDMSDPYILLTSTCYYNQLKLQHFPKRMSRV